MDTFTYTEANPDMRLSKRLTLLLAAGMLVGLGLFAAGRSEAALGRADRILVDKSERKLMLMRAGKVLKTYGISLGFSPKGAKTRRGDGRTPEGKYAIDTRNPRSRFTLGLHVSYPNAKDRAQARKRGVDPGGNIMIHGLPNGRPSNWKKQFTNWTAGCIAVSNSAIREIWHAVPNGTPIEIRP